MSLTGKAAANSRLRGKINGLETIRGYSAYEIALIHGFEGTEEEWLDSLVADEKIAAAVEAYMKNHPASVASIASVSLLASAWVGSGNLYSQVVDVPGVTKNSQVDLTPSVEQLSVFYNKSVAFVAENRDGVVTVYAIGQKPDNDYTMQVTVTEVNV